MYYNETNIIFVSWNNPKCLKRENFTYFVNFISATIELLTFVFVNERKLL